MQDLGHYESHLTGLHVKGSFMFCKQKNTSAHTHTQFAIINANVR